MWLNYEKFKVIPSHRQYLFPWCLRRTTLVLADCNALLIQFLLKRLLSPWPSEYTHCNPITKLTADNNVWTHERQWLDPLRGTPSCRLCAKENNKINIKRRPVSLSRQAEVMKMYQPRFSRGILSLWCDCRCSTCGSSQHHVCYYSPPSSATLN